MSAGVGSRDECLLSCRASVMVQKVVVRILLISILILRPSLYILPPV